MESVQDNFYVTGGTLHPNAPSYVERQADRDLLDGLLRGEFCDVLTSRQMGKSSLMVRTAIKLREQGTHVVVLDLTAIGQNLTPEQWYDGLIVRMARQLRLEDELENFWRDNPRLGPVQRFFSAIRDVVLANRSGPLTVFVDELDVVRSLPFSTDEFFAAIRECYTRRTEDEEFKRLTFCLLGVATPNDLIRDTRITPFNIGRRIELNDFTPEEAAPLAQGLRSSQPEKDDAGLLLAHILDWTGGHPYLTQRLCQAAARDIGKATSADVDRACDRLFLSHGARERDDNLLFVRERILRSEVDLAGLLELYGRVCAGRRVEDDETNSLVTVLRLSGLVRVAGGELRVRNRIYEHVFERSWIRAHLPDADVRRQRAAYRRGMVRAAAVATIILAGVSLLALYAVKQARLARESSAQALLAQAQAGRLSGRAGQRFDSLRAISKAAIIRSTPELRNEAIAVLALTDLRRARQWEALPAGTKALAFDPLLQRYARAGEKGQISVRRIEDDQELLNLQGIGVPVERLLFSPNGHFLAAQYLDDSVNQLQVFDLDRREDILNVVDGVHENALDFSPDSRRLAVAQKDGLIHLYALDSGREIITLSTETSPHSLRFHPTGRKLAVSSRESLQVRIMDLESRQVLRSLTHRGQVNAVCWHPDGLYLATACADGDLYIWDSEKGEQYALLKGSEGEPREATFNHRGDLLAAIDSDETLRLWHPFTGRALTRVPGSGVSGRLQFGPEDDLLASISTGSQAILWEVTAGDECRSFHGHAGAGKGPSHVSISSDGRLMASASGDGIQLWNLASGKKLDFLKLGATPSVLFDAARPAFIASDLFGLHRFPLHFHQTATNVLAHLGPAENLNLSTPVGPATLSPDGQFLACVHEQFNIVVRDLRQTAPVSEEVVLKSQRAATRIAISLGGEWLARCAADPTPVRVWRTRQPTNAVDLPIKGPAHLAFSPDGQWLVTGGSGQFRFWKIGSWQAGPVISRTGAGDQPGPLAFSLDGKLLAIAKSPTVVELVDATTARPLARLEAPDQKRLSWLCFSPDGRTLAAATESQLIQVWDLSLIRRELAELKLDWPMPPYPQTKLVQKRVPLELAVAMGNLESAKPGMQQEIETLTRTIRNAPNDGQAYHERAHAYARLQRLGEAENDFRKSIDLDPRRIAYYLCLADFLLEQDRLPEALLTSTRAVETEPQRLEGYIMRGDVYLEMKNYESAIADMRHALLVSTNSLQATLMLALTLAAVPENLRSPAEALILAERAVQLSPSNHLAYLALGMAQYRVGQSQPAVESLEKAIEIHPDRDAMMEQYYLAMSYQELGQKEKAEKSFTQAGAWKTNQAKLKPRELEQARKIDSEVKALLTKKGSR